jgi:homopolymeric O-antigen transport system permease protein
MNLAGRLGELLGEQIEYRELLIQLTLRDLLLRYRQTAIGLGWAALMPVVNTAVFSVIFVRVTQIHTPVPYPLFAYTGFLVWNFFASSVRFSMASLTGNANLVQKVYFPREIFPFSAVLVGLVDLMVGSVVLAALMAYYGYGVTPALLFLPVVVAVGVAFTAGVALLLAMSNLFYRDVKYLFEVVLMAWMFATSVAYPVESVDGLLGIVLAVNPMTQIIEAYRAVVLYGHLPAAAPFAATACISVAVLIVAWHLFHKAEFSFAENI